MSVTFPMASNWRIQLGFLLSLAHYIYIYVFFVVVVVFVWWSVSGPSSTYCAPSVARTHEDV